MFAIGGPCDGIYAISMAAVSDDGVPCGGFPYLHRHRTALVARLFGGDDVFPIG